MLAAADVRPEVAAADTAQNKSSVCTRHSEIHPPGNAHTQKKKKKKKKTKIAGKEGMLTQRTKN